MAEVKIEPAVIDIKMPMAVTNSINYTFKRKDGTAIDISTSTLQFTVKPVEWDKDASDSTAVIKKNLIVTDGVNGRANLFISHIESFIDAGDYCYDIKIIKPQDGDNTLVDVALKGKFTITSDSTNRVIGVS